MKRKFVDFKVLTASLCCAVVMGVISFVFLKMLGLSSVFREYFPYCIWFLPLSGMLTAFVYKKYGGESSKGNNLIIQSANEGVKVPKRLAVLTFFFTLLTHFSGGSERALPFKSAALLRAMLPTSSDLKKRTEKLSF